MTVKQLQNEANIDLGITTIKEIKYKHNRYSNETTTITIGNLLYFIQTETFKCKDHSFDVNIFDDCFRFMENRHE